MGKKLSSFATRLFGHGNTNIEIVYFMGVRSMDHCVGEPPNQSIGNGVKLNKSMFIL